MGRGLHGAVVVKKSRRSKRLQRRTKQEQETEIQTIIDPILQHLEGT